MPRLLIVDDDAHIAASLAERFQARDYMVSTAVNGADALAKIRRDSPDVVLLDLQMPTMDGFELLKKAKDEGLEATFVVITAFGTVDKAVQAMRMGAYDFLQKPFEPSLVEETVRRATERSALRRVANVVRVEVPRLVTSDAKMRSVVELAQKAARGASTVVLLGESGTGKEVLARNMHQWSSRALNPFVAVNCVALNENLLESELFGHEKGAFTGALNRRVGKIELAHSGTLFLDEIGDISPAFQAKLLRVLQERMFERVGSNESISVDVRVIAATNKDLKKAVADGKFREDLFYRLNVISVQIPALRERKADVVALAEFFAGGRKPLNPTVKRILESYGWPGNVRELKNAIERALALSDGPEITEADLPNELLEAPLRAFNDMMGFHEKVEVERKRIIQEALAQTGGNQTKAAELLGLQRTYLARMIKQMGIGQ